MKITVREAIADIIKLEGVKYVFGHTGGHIMFLWDAIVKAGIEPVFNKQEGNAAYMADGYAKMKGGPAIVLGTSGPGIQNTITGLASSYMDSIPIIAIGAAVATTSAGKNALQESSGRGRATEQLAIFKGVTKLAVLAQTPQSIPLLVREAFRTAMTGRPGTVYLEIPSDFWNEEIEYQQVSPEKYKQILQPAASMEALKPIIDAMYSAERPVILLGEGALTKDINQKFAKFIKTVQIPFFVNPKAKDFTDEYDPLCIGALRNHRMAPQEYGYLNEADLVILLGNRLAQWEFDWGYKNLFPQAKIAQIDPDASEIGRVLDADYSAVGSIESFLEVEKFTAHKNAISLKALAEKYNFKLHRPRRLADSKLGIHPLNLSNIVEELLPQQAVVVADTAYAGSMAINKFRTGPKQRFLVSDYNSPMGYSLPASIGAAFATDDTVVCFIGDGSFQMTCNELGTLQNYHKKVIFIVENNGGCISIKNNLEGYFKDSKSILPTTTFENPDFIKLADAYNINGVSVNTTEEFKTAFEIALKSAKATIIDARIDQSLMNWA